MRSTATVVVAFALLFAPAALSMHNGSSTSDERTAARVIAMRQHISSLRSRTWRYQDQRKARRSETIYLERNVHALPRLHRLAHYWYRNAVAARRAYLAYKREQAQRSLAPSGLPPHYSAWLCIHQYEGSWRDDGAPYYGGLQMDYGFMSSYGADLLKTKGTANNWTPLEQMWVAERAYQSGRGFYPWPNTARMCGLI